MDAQASVNRYLRRCAAVRRSETGSNEVSYYGELHALLTALGDARRPKITAIPNPAGRQGDFPDVACWEETSAVLVLPFEVKGASVADAELLALTQGRRYATSFGGGQVVLTNLWQFILAELDAAGNLVELARADLLDDPAELANKTPAARPEAGADLERLLDHGWTVRASMHDPMEVARLLGYHARLLAGQIESHPAPDSFLRTLTTSLHDGLGMDLEGEFLVSTIVQTLVYGLFAAWLEAEEPSTFKWQEAAHGLQMGVIASLLHDISNPAVIRKSGLSPRLAAVARVLNWVDRDKFEAKLGNGAIEYFYEPFLAAFDENLRNRLGVWYTPREIAEYQVRRVDHHLREDLGIEAGLADPSVIVLDPACGTGTYIAAVLRAIHQYHLDDGQSATVAARRTVKAAHERVIGFEILPAAYIVCALNIHRVLTRDLSAKNVTNERLRIYLTNALTGWAGGARAPQVPLPGLEDELAASLGVKADEPVIAMIGNPPYEGYSAASDPEEKRLAEVWTEPLFRDWGIRKHRLGDLYVRFWRIAVLKIAERQGRGVVSFITNRKWLTGRSAPVMRGHILQRFNKVVVDDLHGDTRGQGGEGSVFSTATAGGITVGVAIATAIRAGELQTGAIAEVQTRDVLGTGAEKRAILASFEGAHMDDNLKPRDVSRSGRWRLAGADTLDGPPPDDYLPHFLSGVQPVRDEAVADLDKESLEDRMRSYFDLELDWDGLVAKYPAFAVTRKRYKGPEVHRRLREQKSYESGRIKRFLFKPLDLRWLYWELDHKLLNEARRDLDDWAQLEGQRFLVLPQLPRRSGPRGIITSAVPGYAAADPDGRAFPRLLPAQAENGTLGFDGQETLGLRTAVAEVWVNGAQAIGITGTDIEVGDTIFYALLTVTHSPKWVLAVPADLDEFAPIPLPGSAETLMAAATTGRDLEKLLDPDTAVTGVTTKIRADLRDIGAAVEDPAQPDRTFTIGSQSGGTGGEWLPENGGTVRWGPGGGWTNISEAVWRYQVGGYPVLPKWLSYRTGGVLDDDTMEQVQDIARRLSAIVELGTKCDDALDAATGHALEPRPT